MRRLTTCTVKQTVARFDGVVHSIGAGVIVDFPKPKQKMSLPTETTRDGYLPKTNKRHLMAAIQFDRRGSHAGV